VKGFQLLLNLVAYETLSYSPINRIFIHLKPAETSLWSMIHPLQLWW